LLRLPRGRTWLAGAGREGAAALDPAENVGDVLQRLSGRPAAPPGEGIDIAEAEIRRHGRDQEGALAISGRVAAAASQCTSLPEPGSCKIAIFPKRTTSEEVRRAGIGFDWRSRDDQSCIDRGS